MNPADTPSTDIPAAAPDPAAASAPSSAPPVANGPALPLCRLPGQSADGQAQASIFLVVDHCLPLAPGLALLQGWLADPQARLARLEARPGAPWPAVGVVPGACTQPRPDVDEGLRPVYAEEGIHLEGPATTGFLTLVTLAEGQTSLELVAHLHNGEQLGWTLPVQDNPPALQALSTPETARTWLPTVLGRLLTRCALPQELAPALAALPASALPATPGTPAHLEVDRAVRIGSGLFVSGWSIDASGRHHSRLLVQCGETAPLLALETGCFSRPDVPVALKGKRSLPGPAVGFVGWLPEVQATPGARHWRFWSADGQGGLVERRMEPLDGDRPDAPDTLLHTVPLTVPNLRSLYDTHVGPALETLFTRRRRSQLPPVTCTRFGEPVAEPEISLIIPLYGRWDFIEHQLAQFRHDPAMRRHELIYFVDDPAIHDAILEYWRSTWPIYEVPFTLAYAGENLGYAGANNAAVSVARGQQVLLLNSDILPTAPGWLAPLSEALAQLPEAGMVGPALLYSDGAVQHAGMVFERYPHWGHLWTNLHPGKGWPAGWMLEGAPREVPALTGACMLMSRQLYLELGGLDEGYVRGDFEDSDLCLKLRARGLKPYLVPQVRLYHLERQSQGLNAQATTRMLLTVFNCWRHTHRWDADITRLMQEFPA